MLTQTAEHALRALLYLGRQGGGHVSVSGIANATGIPAAYLAKLLQSLAASGHLRSRMGRKGGYALARPADQVRVGELMELFSAPDTSRLCLLGDRPCDHARPCAAHVRWSAARQQAFSAMERLRLSDLLDESPSLAEGLAAAPTIGSHMEPIVANL